MRQGLTSNDTVWYYVIITDNKEVHMTQTATTPKHAEFLKKQAKIARRIKKLLRIINEGEATDAQYEEYMDLRHGE